ncbi:MAG: ABC transporter ATP-binding protein, partial [Oscillospiraceae bacterium]|nr:ABC transporter ATP-binding protein [Oscillospiraceae bacterium]
MDDEINFLILDEPTNHLDIDSREWIEEAVEAYDGALLFVSHDRYFIQRFATRIWELENGTITDYPMGFERYRQIKAEQAKNAPRAEVKEKKAEAQPQRVRSNKNAYAAKKQLAVCEREIAKTEEKIAALEADMETYACDAQKLNEVYEEKLKAEEALEQLMERWAELAEEAGE